MHPMNYYVKLKSLSQDKFMSNPEQLHSIKKFN